MVKAHGPPQLREVAVLAGDVAHRAPDQVETPLPLPVPVLPGPGVAGQGGGVYLPHLSVRLHHSP